MMAASTLLKPAAVWWSAVRPATLAASVAPVLAGTAVAVHEGHPSLGAGLAALVVGVALQLGVNFANDYSDFKRGADGPARSGPVRASASGVVSPDAVRLAAIAAFAVAGGAGFALSLAVDSRLLVVGAARLLAGWLYTGGPRPYGYLGLGELFVFIFFGIVATAGTVYVEIRSVPALALLFGCAMGFMASGILVLNNLRDIDSDTAAGKRTLATRIGRDSTRRLLLVLACAAFAVPIVALATKLAGVTVMLVHFAIPITAVPVRMAFAESSAPALVRALRRMAGAELAYAMLLALGLVL